MLTKYRILPKYNTSSNYRTPIYLTPRNILSSTHILHFLFKTIQFDQLKEFQSLENDVCHTVVFGNVATVVASSKTLHWMQMVDGSNVF